MSYRTMYWWSRIQNSWVCVVVLCAKALGTRQKGAKLEERTTDHVFEGTAAW